MFLLNNKRGCMDFDDGVTINRNVCAAFGVEKIICSLDKEDKSPIMQIWVNDHNLRKYNFALPVTDIHEITSVLRAFARHRVLIFPCYRQATEAYLTYELQRCKKIEYTHFRLGWFEYDGALLYLHEQNILPDGFVSKSERKGFGFSLGSREAYEKFLRTTVFPCPTLALAMAIGYSAVVVSRLKDYADLDQAIIVKSLRCVKHGQDYRISASRKCFWLS